MKKLLLSPSFEGKINTNYISSKFKLKLLLGSFIVMLIYANANAQNYPFALDFSSLNTSTLSSVKNYQVSEINHSQFQLHTLDTIIKFSGILVRPFEGGVCLDGKNGGIPLVDIDLLQKDSFGNIIGTYGQQTTGPDGNFEFLVNQTGLNFRVIPFKNNGLDCGINEFDVSFMINHILKIKPLCYHWQRIAADLNYNKKISTSDLLILQKIMLGYSPPFKENLNLTSWRFIPIPDYGKLPNKPCPAYDKQYTFNEYRDRDNFLFSSNSNGFYGIKMGDLDATCDQCTTPVLGENETRAISLKNEVQVKDMNLTENEYYKIPVYVSNLENLTFLSLGFSNKDLVFESFEVHDGLTTVSKTEDKAINFFVNNDQSLRLNSEAPIGYINCRAISTTSLLKNLKLNYEVLQNLSFDTKGNVFDLTLKPIVNSDEKEVFYPNPTLDFVKLNLNKSLLDEFLNISVYSIDGKIVETYQNTKGLELNQIKLLSALPAGSYIIHIYGNNISQKQLVFKQ